MLTWNYAYDFLNTRDTLTHNNLKHDYRIQTLSVRTLDLFSKLNVMKYTIKCICVYYKFCSNDNLICFTLNMIYTMMIFVSIYWKRFSSHLEIFSSLFYPIKWVVSKTKLLGIILLKSNINGHNHFDIIHLLSKFRSLIIYLTLVTWSAIPKWGM